MLWWRERSVMAWRCPHFWFTYAGAFTLVVCDIVVILFIFYSLCLFIPLFMWNLHHGNNISVFLFFCFAILPHPSASRVMYRRFRPLIPGGAVHGIFDMLTMIRYVGTIIQLFEQSHTSGLFQTCNSGRLQPYVPIPYFFLIFSNPWMAEIEKKNHYW